MQPARHMPAAAASQPTPMANLRCAKRSRKHRKREGECENTRRAYLAPFTRLVILGRNLKQVSAALAFSDLDFGLVSALEIRISCFGPGQELLSIESGASRPASDHSK